MLCKEIIPASKEFGQKKKTDRPNTKDFFVNLQSNNKEIKTQLCVSNNEHFGLSD